MKKIITLTASLILATLLLSSCNEDNTSKIEMINSIQNENKKEIENIKVILNNEEIKKNYGELLEIINKKPKIEFINTYTDEERNQIKSNKLGHFKEAFLAIINLSLEPQTSWAILWWYVRSYNNAKIEAIAYGNKYKENPSIDNLEKLEYYINFMINTLDKKILLNDKDKNTFSAIWKFI